MNIIRHLPCVRYQPLGLSPKFIMAAALKGLNQERAVLRTSLTKTSKKIEDFLAKEQLGTEDLENMSSQLELMHVRYEELNSKDSQILSIVLEDEAASETDLEEDKKDSSTVLYYKCKSAVQKILVEKQSTESRSSDFVSIQSTSRCKYKLPVLKLKQFSRELKDWLPFWGQFQKIHENPKLDEVDKLGYLTMSMATGSPGEQLVSKGELSYNQGNVPQGHRCSQVKVWMVRFID